MADNKFELAKCQAHLKAVSEAAKKNVGKAGHNPWIWITQNVKPLADKLEDAANHTLELQTAILALPTTPDTSKLKTDVSNLQHKSFDAETFYKDHPEAAKGSVIDKPTIKQDGAGLKPA
jgi:hypothetical protein